MSPLLFLAAAAAVTAAAGAGWTALRRRRAARGAAAMRRRLAAAYPTAEPPAKPLPLRAPPGRVALCEGGLALALGPPDQSFRAVPWSALRQVLPAGHGQVSVHVAQVGEVIVPGSLGRALWDQFTRLRTA